MKILANDGIDSFGKRILEDAGFEVITAKIAQDELASRIVDYDILIVRSATKVTKAIIQASNLSLIARAGVGLDNIDMEAAAQKNISVVNTPNSSTRSVAELVFAHLFSLARFLHKSNRQMPQNGIDGFKEMKKEFSDGFELKGKKMGIIGCGRIGNEVAKMAIGLGMEVLPYDLIQQEFSICVSLANQYKAHDFNIKLQGFPLQTVLKESDFVSIHTPGSEEDRKSVV